MLHNLERYLRQALQVACFGILKTLVWTSPNAVLQYVASGKELRYQPLLVACSQKPISK